jgi:hypothetical protein
MKATTLNSRGFGVHSGPLLTSSFPSNTYWIAVGILALFGCVGGHFFGDRQKIKSFIFGAAFPSLLISMVSGVSKELNPASLLAYSTSTVEQTNDASFPAPNKLDVKLKAVAKYADSSSRNLNLETGALEIPDIQGLEQVLVYGDNVQPLSLSTSGSQLQGHDIVLGIKENKWSGLLQGLGVNSVQRYELKVEAAKDRQK